MLTLLKSRLGITALEERFQFYHTYWMESKQHFEVLNDHLVDIKEILKTPEEIRHTEIMARLGMILTVLNKIKPHAPHEGESPMAQMLPLPCPDAPAEKKRVSVQRMQGIMGVVFDFMQKEKKASIGKITRNVSIKTTNRRGKRQAIIGTLSYLYLQGYLDRVSQGVYVLKEETPSLPQRSCHKKTPIHTKKGAFVDEGA